MKPILASILFLIIALAIAFSYSRGRYRKQKRRVRTIVKSEHDLGIIGDGAWLSTHSNRQNPRRRREPEPMGM